MPKTIQLRNVPDDVYLVLKTRADKAGISLPQYVKAGLTRDAEAPTNDELREQILAGTSANLSRKAILRAIHSGRDERDRNILRAVNRHRAGSPAQ